jgi:hypothetical protein
MKIKCTLLIVAAAAFALTGCGSSSSSKKPATNSDKITIKVENKDVNQSPLASIKKAIYGEPADNVEQIIIASSDNQEKIIQTLNADMNKDSQTLVSKSLTAKGSYIVSPELNIIGESKFCGLDPKEKLTQEAKPGETITVTYICSTFDKNASKKLTK